MKANSFASAVLSLIIISQSAFAYDPWEAYKASKGDPKVASAVLHEVLLGKIQAPFNSVASYPYFKALDEGSEMSCEHFKNRIKENILTTSLAQGLLYEQIKILEGSMEPSMDQLVASKAVYYRTVGLWGKMLEPAYSIDVAWLKAVDKVPKVIFSNTLVEVQPNAGFWLVENDKINLSLADICLNDSIDLYFFVDCSAESFEDMQKCEKAPNRISLSMDELKKEVSKHSHARSILEDIEKGKAR